jgi:FlaG/FlaF family flagellin (archaellin)
VVIISPSHLESGVSEVVGEMLMIGLVIILIGVFAAALGNFLPTTREPSVTILMTTDNMNGTLTLWHKGGDWVKNESLTVVINYPNDTLKKIPSSDLSHFILVPGDKTVFDLGSNITVITGEPFKGNETVSLVTPRARIFIGRVAI